MKKLELLPAIDVKEGRAVRLFQGELSQQTAYGSPSEVPLEFLAALFRYGTLGRITLL